MSRAVIYETYGGPEVWSRETFRSRTPARVRSASAWRPPG